MRRPVRGSSAASVISTRGSSVASVQDIAQLLAAQPAQSPEMGALVAAARNQLATQPQRLALQQPTSYGTPEADAAAMQPETYANPAVRHAMGELAAIPQRAIEGSMADMANLGSGEPKQSVAPATDAALWMMGGSGAVPAEANTLRSGLLSVARRKPDGTIAVGKPGDIHSDLMTRQELNAATDSPEVASSMGFATPDGKFMTRDEALQFAMRNEPARAAWSAQQPQFGLDAATYHNEPR